MVISHSLREKKLLLKENETLHEKKNSNPKTRQKNRYSFKEERVKPNSISSPINIIGILGISY
ncbi:UNVERIFIED_CONTAM: hypothetical protein NCL1_40434 [Trichonephila clavipes]